MILETPERLDLAALDKDEILKSAREGKIDFGTLLRGRIFSSAGELQWRLMDGRYRVVYLGEEAGIFGDSQPLKDESGNLAGLRPVGRSQILWGERTDMEKEWLEQSVLRIFHYPFEGGSVPRGRLQVVVEEWRRPDGTAAFFRWCGLRETQKGGEEDA
jgi:hypothetical protein